jgi:hypothetical protein
MVIRPPTMALRMLERRTEELLSVMASRTVRG